MITTHDVAAPMALILMAKSVIEEGVRVTDYRDKLTILLQLEAACAHELKVLPRQMHASTRRHAQQAAAKILAPFIEDRMSCGKCALALFYAINILAEECGYDIGANKDFESVMHAILSQDGTVTEFANIDRLDKSAQKHARRIVTALNSLGYFDKREREAA